MGIQEFEKKANRLQKGETAYINGMMLIGTGRNWQRVMPMPDAIKEEFPDCSAEVAEDMEALGFQGWELIACSSL